MATEEIDGAMGDVDVTIWTVRNAAGDIVGERPTEEEALAYGSHLADANPDELYTVVAGRWNPIPDWQTPRPVDADELGQPAEGTRTNEELRDATEAELMLEPTLVLQAMVAGETGATEKTVELAKAVLERRGWR